MGRHNKPSVARRVGETSLRNMKAVGVVGVGVAAATAGPAILAVPANASTLGAIEQCESGGNPTAQNPSSTASGLFQFLDSSFQAYGGHGRAKDASPAEQLRVAENAVAQSGFAPWAASQSCWSGQSHSVTGVESAPVQHATRHSEQHVTEVDHRNGDGSGEYTCDSAHFGFAACGSANVGEVVHYPKYDHVTVPPKPTVHLAALNELHTAKAGVYHVVSGDSLWSIGEDHGESWQTLYRDNHSTVGSNPDLITPGEVLRLG